MMSWSIIIKDYKFQLLHELLEWQHRVSKSNYQIQWAIRVNRLYGFDAPEFTTSQESCSSKPPVVDSFLIRLSVILDNPMDKIDVAPFTFSFNCLHFLRPSLKMTGQKQVSLFYFFYLSSVNYVILCGI